jgi:hypothetical protein
MHWPAQNLAAQCMFVVAESFLPAWQDRSGVSEIAWSFLLYATGEPCICGSISMTVGCSAARHRPAIPHRLPNESSRGCAINNLDIYENLGDYYIYCYNYN